MYNYNRNNNRNLINNPRINRQNKSNDINITNNNRVDNLNRNFKGNIKSVDKTTIEPNPHIIKVDKGKIINLSNLDKNFTYTTDKYSCIYVNKRDKNIKRYEIPNYGQIKINISKYYVNKRPETNIKKEEPQTNGNISKSKTTYAVNLNDMKLKYPKKENKKKPLKNYLNEYDNEVLADNKLESEKDKNKINDNNKDNEKNKGKINEKEKDKSKTPDKNNNFINVINRNSTHNNQKKMVDNNNIIKRINSYKDKTDEDDSLKNKKENTNKTIYAKKKNSLENNNNNNISIKDTGVGNTSEKNLIKISNKPKKPEFSFNRENLTINSNNPNKKSHIFKIKRNDKIILLNNNDSNNDNKEEKKKYKISSNVVNEKIFRKNFIEQELDDKEERNLSISIQSIDDANIMDIAKGYIDEDENPDKKIVINILNSKKRD